MGSELEEQKKCILPYAQRAEEIKQVDPKIAYYCRLFAVDQGLRMEKGRRHKEIDELLVALLKQLERDKPMITLEKENDKFYCEEFALKVFSRADRVDRAGKADANTARAYYAASVFLDILNQFGEMDAELTQKQKYALWRAAEIRKAIREGRPPQPAPSSDPAPEASGPVDAFAMLPDAAPAQPWAAFPPGAPAPPEASTPSSAPTTSWQPPSLNLDLPTPPIYTPGPDTGSASTSTPTTTPPQLHIPCRFPPGSKVLYSAGHGAPPEPGTVGKVNSSGQACSYMVALRDRIVDAADELLSLDCTTGAEVLFVSPEGQLMPAIVVACTTSAWPPQYLVRVAATGREVHAHYMQVASVIAGPAPMDTQGGPSLPTTRLPGPPAVPGPAPSVPTPPSPPKPTEGADFNWYPSVDAIIAPVPTPSTSTPSHAAASAPRAGSAQPSSSFQPPLEAISEAHKQAKYACSSLAFDDVDNAVGYLKRALELLTGSSRH